MNFDDIFLFVKLVNIGTFTELAKQLNVSQSHSFTEDSKFRRIY